MFSKEQQKIYIIQKKGRQDDNFILDLWKIYFEKL